MSGQSRTRAAAGQGQEPSRVPPRDGQSAVPRRAGRPRSAEAGTAILEAASELLSEKGLLGMSMEEVAARAGVGKATVYRRWPSRGALALDAFLSEFRSQLPLPQTGSLRGDLRSGTRAWVRAVTTSRAGKMLAGLIAEAQRDPSLAAAWRERVFNPLREQHKEILDAAARRGELPPGTDADLVLDLIFGAAYHRLLHGHLPLDERFATKAVDLVVDGLERRRGLPAPAPEPAREP